MLVCIVWSLAGNLIWRISTEWYTPFLYPLIPMTKEIQHTLLSLLMFSMAMTSFAGEPTGVHLLFSDGSDKWFLFTTQPVVTFSDSELTFTTSDASFAYTY